MSRKPLIVWSDPPRSRRGGRRPLKYRAHIEALLERPGEWACLQRSEDNKPLRKMQSTLGYAAYKALVAPGRLQVAVRATDSGDYGLWARVIEAEQ